MFLIIVIHQKPLQVHRPAILSSFLYGISSFFPPTYSPVRYYPIVNLAPLIVHFVMMEA